MSAFRKSAQSAIDSSHTSAMDLAPCSPLDSPASVTARISGLSRVPAHTGQGTSRMKPS
ncbi:Uncharacterised protein [Mycobacterium tuberculosis]|uniref:Uncharacterized protein n=1 Tax=Mycobacterium tuberculosis TaxID=1773 RepID=A0A654U808_MYCTX|nr:Uncharacterised protein [Mycobacterium tuberculosis]